MREVEGRRWRLWLEKGAEAAVCVEVEGGVGGWSRGQQLRFMRLFYGAVGGGFGWSESRRKWRNRWLLRLQGGVSIVGVALRWWLIGVAWR